MCQVQGAEGAEAHAPLLFKHSPHTYTVPIHFERRSSMKHPTHMCVVYTHIRAHRLCCASRRFILSAAPAQHPPPSPHTPYTHTHYYCYLSFSPTPILSPLCLQALLYITSIHFERRISHLAMILEGMQSDVHRQDGEPFSAGAGLLGESPGAHHTFTRPGIVADFGSAGECRTSRLVDWLCAGGCG